MSQQTTSSYKFDATKSTGDNVVYATTSYVDSLTETCRSDSANFQDIDVNCSGAINASNIDLSQLQDVDVNCVEENLGVDESADALAAYNDQLATSIAQNPQANPNGASKDAIYNNVASVSTSVVNSIENTCLSSAFQSQKVDVKKCGSAQIRNVNWSQMSDNTLDCVMKNQRVINASVALSALTGNTGASASKKKLSTWAIVGIAAACLVVVVLAIAIPVSISKRRTAEAAERGRLILRTAAESAASAAEDQKYARLQKAITGAIRNAAPARV